jgi:hypothetical protein
MKTFCLIIALALLSFGCGTTHDKSTCLNLNLDREEKNISKRLQRKPVPLPKVTPFDSDKSERNAYLKGFRKAWDHVVSGDFLHGKSSAPIPHDIGEYWRAGWNDGYEVAVAYWVEAAAKRSEEILQKALPENSSSP